MPPERLELSVNALKAHCPAIGLWGLVFVGAEGLEPSKSVRTSDLQSDTFAAQLHAPEIGY